MWDALFCHTMALLGYRRNALNSIHDKGAFEKNEYFLALSSGMLFSITISIHKEKSRE